MGELAAVALCALLFSLNFHHTHYTSSESGKGHFPAFSRVRVCGCTLRLCANSAGFSYSDFLGAGL